MGRTLGKKQGGHCGEAGKAVYGAHGGDEKSPVCTTAAAYLCTSARTAPGPGSSAGSPTAGYATRGWAAEYRRLAEARNKALACRKLKLDGRDPIEERRAQPQAVKLESARAMTFRQCGEAYAEAHRAGWKNDKRAAQWPSTH